ncbi:MAG TPA: YciI family protein [Caulobacteraceae bacterium]|nr:YciI family protein [Caulobacteraceae bacterium]
MLYAILCYNDEAMVTSWTRAEDDAVMAKLSVVHDRLQAQGKLGPALRLLPTTAATTLYKSKDMVIDGPYAETKEALLGFYILDCESLDEAVQACRDLAEANPGGAYEIRPVSLFVPGSDMSARDVAGSFAR